MKRNTTVRSALGLLSPDEKRLILEIANEYSTTKDGIGRRIRWSASKINRVLHGLHGKQILLVSRGEANGQGRKPNVYRFNPGLGFFLGIHCDILADHLTIVDFAGTCIRNKSYPAKSYADRALADFSETIDDFLEAVPASVVESIRAAGISTATRFNEPGSVSFRSPSYTNTAMEPLRDTLAKRFRFPIYIGRPQVLICYGKYRSTLLAPKKSFINIIVTDNVGISIFIKGESYLGHSGLSGDLGHIKIPGNSLPCYCGSTGCLRTLISYMGICREVQNRIREVMNNGGSHALNLQDFTGPDYEKGVRLLIMRAVEHDPLATDIVYSAASHLGTVLATIVSLLNPEYLTIQTILAEAGPLFTERVRTIIRKNCLELYSMPLSIEFSSYEQYSVSEGSAFFARSNFLKET